jgi:hypothetical protein
VVLDMGSATAAKSGAANQQKCQKNLTRVGLLHGKSIKGFGGSNM